MTTKTLIGLLAVTAVCSCGEKKTTQTLQPVKVRTMVVGKSLAGNGQTYSGTIEEESGQALSFAGMGTVQSINVSEGQFVRKGQLIGIIDATSARNAYDAAVASKEQALDAQKRMKMLHDNGSLPEIKWVETETQVRQAKAQEQIARKSLSDTRLFAPFSGYIIKKDVEPGANVGPGVPVVNLVRIEQVKAKISVPEEEIAGIRIGMPMWVRVSALGNRTFLGKVTEKNVSADALSRSYEVKAVIANPRHELLPGMIAEASLSLSPAAGRRDTPASSGGAASPYSIGDGRGGSFIALPAGIVQLDPDNRTFVWTVVSGKAKKTYITTGDNVGDKVAVTGGLLSGDKVITEGQQKVSTGMEVKE